MIIGDSNLTTIPAYTQDQLQIEGYPEAKFGHITEILKKIGVNTEVEKLILACGINHREQLPKTAEKNMRTAVKTAKHIFPAATIYVPEVNFSEHLEEADKVIMRKLNAAIREQNHIPKLQDADFQTKEDHIHWTEGTARKMLEHWSTHLN